MQGGWTISVTIRGNQQWDELRERRSLGQEPSQAGDKLLDSPRLRTTKEKSEIQISDLELHFPEMLIFANGLQNAGGGGKKVLRAPKQGQERLTSMKSSSQGAINIERFHPYHWQNPRKGKYSLSVILFEHVVALIKCKHFKICSSIRRRRNLAHSYGSGWTRGHLSLNFSVTCCQVDLFLNFRPTCVRHHPWWTTFWQCLLLALFRHISHTTATHCLDRSFHLHPQLNPHW